MEATARETSKKYLIHIDFIEGSSGHGYLRWICIRGSKEYDKLNSYQLITTFDSVILEAVTVCTYQIRAL